MQGTSTVIVLSTSRQFARVRIVPRTVQLTRMVPLCSGDTRPTGSVAPWRTFAEFQLVTVESVPVQVARDVTLRS